MTKSIQGKVYILEDNIDTDQILTAEYLKINPSTLEGYNYLGNLAMCGLPLEAKPFRNGDGENIYSIIIAGENFGCGSSREHAVIALGAAGVKIVLAKSFARIFYRNSIVTGEVMPLTYTNPLMNLTNGDLVSIDIENHKISLIETNKVVEIDPIGELSKIVDSGGLFKYARAIGKISNQSDLINLKEI